jgi:uncharacterized protein
MAIGSSHRVNRLRGWSYTCIVGLALVIAALPVMGQTLKDTLTFANRDIDRLWDQQFQRLRRTWVMPKTYVYVGRIKTPCGFMDQGNAQYCPRSHAIYVNHGFVRRVNEHVGDFATVTVLAHEYGHVVQHLLNLSDLNRYLIQDELQADCFAGVYAKDAMSRGLLDATDIPEAMAQSYASGDRQFHWESHGTPQQRVKAFRLGYAQGFQSCLGYSNWPLR